MKKLTSEQRAEVKAGMVKYVKKRKIVEPVTLIKWAAKRYKSSEYDIRPLLWSLTADNILTFTIDWKVTEGRGFNWIDC